MVILGPRKEDYTKGNATRIFTIEWVDDRKNDNSIFGSKQLWGYFVDKLNIADESIQAFS